MARARNQPRKATALIVVAVLSLLAVLVARANAAPAREGSASRTERVAVADRDDDEAGDRDEADQDGDGDRGGRRSGRRALGEPWSEAGPCDCDEVTFARVVASAPAVAEVVAAAQRAAGVDEDPSTGWRRRSKLAALVPVVSARVGNTQSWRDVVDPTVNRAAAFDVRASWRLDHLVFDSIELRIAAQEVARRRERRAVAATASRAYFAWLRAEAGAAMRGGAGPAGPAGAARSGMGLQAAEAAAELDALTDGWFSDATAKLRESR